MAGTAAVPGGGDILPSVITDITTQSSGVSVPGGIRTAALIGLGSRTEVLITSATGGGTDGLSPTYSGVSGSDGRHFILQVAPLVSNRTTLFKNGIPLAGLEDAPDNLSFSSSFDYRIDLTTGKLELQTAALVDQGGALYSVGATNVGVGTISGLVLSDINAPTETWTVKCVSVQRNTGNTPIDKTARFVAFGSVSGNVLDANGNPVVWVADGTTATNGILSFDIVETQVSGVSVSTLREGDYFTIKVKGGALKKGDSLSATYIAETDLNDPVFFDNVQEIRTKHGAVSLDNTLSLGAQLAFANTTPGIMTVQAAPSVPRRLSFEVSDSVPATSTDLNDFILPLPVGVKPGVDTTVHFFVTNPITGVETQLLPNKFPFYTLSNASSPTLSSFINSNANVPSGNSFSYSVIETSETLHSGTDGYMDRSLTSRTKATFASDSFTYDASYVGKQVLVFDATNKANNGTFSVISVSNGALGISATGSPAFSDFVNESSLSFRLIDSLTGSVVASTSGSDGVLTAIGSSATATFTSAAVNFVPADPFNNSYFLQITASANGNVGLFDITAYNSGTDTLTIGKSFVSEHSLKFEVLDTASTSDYVVINHNIVPDGNSLRITMVDEKDENFFDAGWENALTSLESQEVDIVVPLPKQTISAIFQTTLSHCQTMSNSLNKKERVMFAGAINGLTPDNLTGAKSAAVEDIGVLEGLQGDSAAEILSGNTEDLTNYSVKDAFGGTFRCVYFFPDQIVVPVGSDNQIIDGFYIGAAAAGYLSGVNDIAQPITRKVFAGLTILRNRLFGNRVLRQLADAGVCALQPVAGGGRVVWGITTTQSGFVEEEELSIIFIRDRIAKNFRTGLDGFIGTAEDIDTVATIMTRAGKLLDGFISQKLITDWKDLVVKRDSAVPTQFNVSARCQPRYAINFIYVQVGIGIIS